MVAAAIHEDIADSGWKIDSLFGTEVQLLERYGVSLSVLREAVRLLEYHTAARMRRGPGGGLVVTAPQARASIDTIALYLEYRKPARENLQLVRDAIELDNVAAVVKNRERQPVQRFIKTHSLEIEVIWTSGTFYCAAVWRSSGSTPSSPNLQAIRCWMCSFGFWLSCSADSGPTRGRRFPGPRMPQRRARPSAHPRRDRQRRRQPGEIPRAGTWRP